MSELSPADPLSTPLPMCDQRIADTAGSREKCGASSTHYDAGLDSFSCTAHKSDSSYRFFAPARVADNYAEKIRRAKAEAWLEGADWAVTQIDRDHDDSYLSDLERTLLRDSKVANPYRPSPPNQEEA